MIDIEFYAFWGACLGFVLLFGAFVGILELIQKNKNRHAKIEAEEKHRAYLRVQADKKRWETNMAEAEKLFEEDV